MTSVYIHVPFCVSKCPYCAFESAPARSGDVERYLAGLARETRRRVRGRPRADTVYIGGGTPTALSAREMERLWGIVSEAFDIAPGAEITVEANPASMRREHTELWRDIGVTRVSLGVQSFDDRELAYLGRLHDASAARAAAEMIHSAGTRLSLDLIFGLPIGTPRAWASSMRTALATGASHLSVYHLAIEPGTKFERDGVVPTDGALEYRAAQLCLPQHGLNQYEIASFAVIGHESRHNLNYWDEGEYIGLGPGAWSYIGGVRMRNVWPLDAYAEADEPALAVERLTGAHLAREAAVLRLRTSHGIEWERFFARYDRDEAERIRARLKEMPSELVTHTHGRTALSKRGMSVANAIWREIV